MGKATSSGSRALPAKDRAVLLQTLKARFESHMERHEGVAWAQVLARLEANPAKLWSLHEMERTGGEPDVVSVDGKTGQVVFADCAEQTPEGRRNLCYDAAALAARKKFKPKDSAARVAEEMGVELMTEEEYRTLQKKFPFDTKSSSWVKTPERIRKLGGALFCDRRFDTVFVYHNGAESYYAGRGFRASLRV